MRKYLTPSLTSIHVVLLLTVFTSLHFISTAFAAGEQASISYEGKAVVKAVDMDKGIVKLAHGPISSLKWPAMTMDFKVKENALLQGIKINDSVTFTFIQANGDNVITRIQSDQQPRQGY